MTDASLAVGTAAEDRIAVASNWRLVWWRFRRHHLAMASGVLLLLLYLVVVAPDFFSTQDPERTDARQAFIPPQAVHPFDDGRLAPWVPAIVGKRNPTTLRMEWTTDPHKKLPVRLFARGFRWKLLGLIDTNLHLIGPLDPRRSGSSSWAPTGWGAISGRASCTARGPR